MKWILNPIVFAIVSGILLMYLTQGSRIQHFIGAAICLGVAAFFFKVADTQNLKPYNTFIAGT